MTLSVDDLVSSLNASHIGQEAIDLAALQAQLAQAFFASTSSSPIPLRRSTNTQPCNTPTTSSFHWGQSSGNTSWDATARDDIDEDERMVEELLLPSSPTPMSMSSTPSSAYFPPASQYTYQESPASSFASTDPFYLAQLQAMSTPSLFAQSGRPNQASPFLLAQQQQEAQQQQQQQQQQRENSGNHNHHHGYHSSNPLEAHTALFVKTGAAF